MSSVVSFTFNGKSSSEFPWLVVNRIGSSFLPPIENYLVEVPGRSGAYHMGQKIKPKPENLKITVLADTQEELAEKKRILAQWLKTNEPKPFVYNFEPTMEYKAVLDGETDLDKIVTDGETVINFIFPDPYAYGESKSQTIAGIPTIKEDINSQASWSKGTLSNVEATSTGLILQNEGIDYNPTISDWTGTHNQTKDSNGKLVLDSVATPSNLSYSDDFTGGTNTGVTATGGQLTMTGLPTWDESDNMSSFATTGWEARLTPTNVTQENGYVRLIGEQQQSVALTQEYASLAFPQTYEFVYKLLDPPNPLADHTTRASFHIIETGTTNNSRFQLSLEKSTNWTWVRVVLRSKIEGDVYINGLFDRTFTTPSSTTLTPRSQFIIEKDLKHQGDLQITQFYRKSGTLHAKVSSYNFPYLGTRVTPEIDLSSLGTYQSSISTLTSTTPTGFDGFNSTSKMEVDLFKNGSWKGYQPVASGQPIPGLSIGENLSGVKARIKETLTTYDVSNLPSISSCGFTIDGQVMNYQPSGTYTALPDSGIQTSVRARQATFSWTENKPLGTSVKAYVALEDNGVLGDYLEVANGGNIPQISTTVDLSQAKLFTRFDLSTTDSTLTPEVINYSYDVLSAYKNSGNRISEGVSLSSLESAGQSLITWDGSPDNSPNIKVYTQIVSDPDLPAESGWLESRNGYPIPGLNEGDSLAGKTLYTKVNLTSNGTSSSIIHRLLWEVQKTGGNQIEYVGTEETYPALTVTFTANVSTFEILHQETGNRLYFPRQFVSGDELVINNKTGKITINGQVDLADMSHLSDYIYLMPGINTIITTPEDSCSVLLEWRDRYK